MTIFGMGRSRTVLAALAFAGWSVPKTFPGKRLALFDSEGPGTPTLGYMGGGMDGGALSVERACGVSHGASLSILHAVGWETTAPRGRLDHKPGPGIYMYNTGPTACRGSDDGVFSKL